MLYLLNHQQPWNAIRLVSYLSQPKIVLAPFTIPLARNEVLRYDLFSKLKIEKIELFRKKVTVTCYPVELSNSYSRG